MTVVAEHVFNFHGVGVDPHDLVAAVDDFALAGDKDVVTLSEKHLGGLAGAAGEANELEVDRRRARRRRRRWWRSRNLLDRRFNRLGNFRSRAENVASGALVFGVFTQLEKIEAEARVEGDDGAGGRAAGGTAGNSGEAASASRRGRRGNLRRKRGGIGGSRRLASATPSAHDHESGDDHEGNGHQGRRPVIRAQFHSAAPFI
jgi:hypothetical protein